MASRDINDLIGPAQILYHEFSIGMSQANIQFMITCVKRTKDEQIALYSMGREKLIVVNELRRLAKMSIITQEQNIQVTWTLNSRHFPLGKEDPLCRLHPEWEGKCLAFDYAILKENNKPTWDLKADIDHDQIPDYQEAADIARSVGFRVGADFKPNPDYVHVEFDRRKTS